MTGRSSLAERWTAAVEAALELSTPAEIVAHIRTADAPDDGLRAASYEARTTKGHLGDSHPERLALDPARTPAIRDSWKRNDEITVAREGLRFIDAISAINAARDHGTADTWDEAVKDAHLMAELHGGQFIASVIDTTEDDTPFRDTVRAIDALSRLAYRWRCPHVPSALESAWATRLADEDCCAVHLQVAPPGRWREPRHRGKLCRTCYELARAGNVEAPPVWLVEVWIDQPGQVVWRNARNRWLDDQSTRSA